jgi:PLP dependent protein
MPFLDLSERVADLREQIALAARRGGHAQNTRIIAVTKTHPSQAVVDAVGAGLTDVGENKVQEAMRKQEELEQSGGAPGVTWHLIGHLQRNKVKLLRSFHLFHALDSERLADAIQLSFAADDGVGGMRVAALVQVNVVGEESKGGHALNTLSREADRLLALTAIDVRGVMTMAPADADEITLRKVFSGARTALATLRAAGHDAGELSMGMSQDYLIAVEEGATMVRLGTVLFGERE